MNLPMSGRGGGRMREGIGMEGVRERSRVASSSSSVRGGSC